MKLFTKRLPIELTNGKFYEIRMLSITKIEEFRSTFNLLSNELNDERYKSINIEQALGEDGLVKTYIDSILNLVGLRSDDVPFDVLYNLLFPHQNNDGSYTRQGELISFLCGEPVDGVVVPKEEVDAYANALAQLWHATQDFEQAMTVLNSLNYDDLNKVLEIRAELAKSPEDKMKEKAKQRAILAKDELAAKFKAGTKIEIGPEIDINSLL